MVVMIVDGFVVVMVWRCVEYYCEFRVIIGCGDVDVVCFMQCVCEQIDYCDQYGQQFMCVVWMVYFWGLVVFVYGVIFVEVSWFSMVVGMVLICNIVMFRE